MEMLNKIEVLDKRKVVFRTLSPVHIGTGEELTPLEYVVIDRVFYRISERQLQQITNNILGEEGYIALANWVDDIFKEMESIRDNRELSMKNDQLNPYQFFKKQSKVAEFISNLKKGSYGIQQVPVILDEKYRYSKQESVVLGQVRSMTKRTGNRPYIPGTSLKGSLRTALFFHFLEGYENIPQLERILNEQLNRRAKKERFADPLEHEAFYCGIKDLDSGRMKHDDEKMDLMKLVEISDAYVCEQGGTSMQLAKINIYLVEKERVDNPRQKGGFRAVQQSQTSYSEIIPRAQTIEVNFDFNIDFLLQVKSMLRGDEIPSGNRTVQWIGLRKKVEQLFGLDLQTLTQENKDEKRNEVLNHLMKCWASFSSKQLDAHQAWFEHFEQNDAKKDLSSRIQHGFTPVTQRKNRTLVHLGYAVGFNGTTALLYFLKDKEARIAKLYKRILESFNIGNKPGNRGSYEVNLNRFPKSRRLVEEDRVISPMGWLELLDGNETSLEQVVETSIREPQYAAEEVKPAAPVQAEFFKGTLNPKKPAEFDAVVVRSGMPNIVQVYISEDNMPELELMAYRSPLEVGKVIVVLGQVTKKNELKVVGFRREK